jgi:hypothetical protein
VGEKKLEWISLDQAEEIVKGFFTRATLYQYIHKKKLERRGPFKKAMIRKDQLLKVCKLEGIIDA